MQINPSGLENFPPWATKNKSKQVVVDLCVVLFPAHDRVQFHLNLSLKQRLKFIRRQKFRQIRRAPLVTCEVYFAQTIV